jgi:hypothetical protein
MASGGHMISVLIMKRIYSVTYPLSVNIFGTGVVSMGVAESPMRVLRSLTVSEDEWRDDRESGEDIATPVTISQKGCCHLVY